MDRAVGAEGPGLLIIFPSDRQVVGATGVWLVAESRGEANTQVEVRVNGLPIPNVRTVSGMRTTIHHARLSLRPGVNRVEVRALSRGSATEWRTLSVMASPPLVARTDRPPGFAPRAYHGSDLEGRCRACHELASQVRQTSVAGQGCVGCHAEITARPRIHGPVSTGACEMCHQPGPGLPVMQPTAQVCYRCHERPTTPRVIHGPVATGQCVLCHDPHGAQAEFFLRLPTQNVCLECHERANLDQHVMGSFHPTSGRANPLTPGKPLTCASCHEPHGASNRALLRFWPVDTTFCQKCHFRLGR